MPEIRGRYCNWIGLALLLWSMLPAVAMSAVIRADEDHLTLWVAASLLFEPDSSALKSDALRQQPLEAVLHLLKRRRALVAQITVFTDNIGGATANQSFSAARAKALCSALSAAGIRAARLSAHGGGAVEAISSNDTPEGRQENRRVEIRLAPATGP